MIKQMSFLGLVVKDIDEATAFYRDILGLSVNENESVPGQYTQFVTNGGAVFAILTGFEQEGIEQSFDTGLIVEDIDATYQTWKEAGVEVMSAPRDMPFGRTFFFKTPDGQVLRVMTPPSQN
jgi:predicted enzyme related to lactoylglutathione lyase